MKISIAFASILLITAGNVSADEPLAWPRFRGPNGSGVADGEKPPIEFGPEKNVKWKVTAPPGISSPIVAGDKLFFAGSSSSGAEEQTTAPSFDALLKNLDKNQDGAISREEGEKAFQGFFDNQDMNKDGTISRDEFEAIAKMMSEGKSSAFALKAGGSGDITASNTLWKKTKGLPYIASAILYRGQLVIIKDGGIVVASDADTGETAYQQRLGATGSYYASPVAANGHIYFTSLQTGQVTVIKGGSKKAIVVATNPELGERCSATPAIADDTLYLRTAGHIYAFAEEK